MRKPLYHAIVALTMSPLLCSPLQLRGASLDRTGPYNNRGSAAPISAHMRISGLWPKFEHYPTNVPESSPDITRYDLGISVLCMHPACLSILDTYPIISIAPSYIRNYPVADEKEIDNSEQATKIYVHGIGGMVSIELPHFLCSGEERFRLQTKNKNKLSSGHRITLGYARILKDNPDTVKLHPCEPKHYLHYEEEEVLIIRLFKRLEISPGIGWAIDLFTPNEPLKQKAGYFNLFACRSYFQLACTTRFCFNSSDVAKRIYEREKYKVWKLNKNKRLDLSYLISSKYEPYDDIYSVPIRLCLLYSIPMSYYEAFVIESEIGYGAVRSLVCEPAMKGQSDLKLSAKKNVNVNFCIGFEHRYNRFTLQNKIGIKLFDYAPRYLTIAQNKSGASNVGHQSLPFYCRTTANMRIYKNMFIGIDMRYLELPGLHVGISL